MKHLVAVNHDDIATLIRLAQQDLAKAQDELNTDEHQAAVSLRATMAWVTEAAVLLTAATR